MKWPWKQDAEVRERAVKASEQAEEARKEYERTVEDSTRVRNVLAYLLYQAEQNEIVEKIQRVARGH